MREKNGTNARSVRQQCESKRYAAQLKEMHASATDLRPLSVAAGLVKVAEKRRCPKLHVDVGNLVRQLHRRCHHVLTLLRIA